MTKNAVVIFLLVCMAGFSPAQKGKTIQVNVSSILNARPVTVLANGKVFGWAKGIDGGGTGDGYLTVAAALANGDSSQHALPDNPLFAENEHHPAIQLHYSNNDTLHYQTRNIAGEGEFSFKVPPYNYTSLFVCLTSAEGPSALQFELKYIGGTDTIQYTLPDYYNHLAPNDRTITYLVHDLAKWNRQNKMAEANHHNIDAVNIRPSANRVLLAVKIKKTKPGYLVFWGAAGVVAR